jgi:hypothetical protein
MEAVLKANRPNLSAGSLRTYLSILNNLAKQIDESLDKPEDVIEHYKKIIDHLSNVPGNARKTRLSALIVYIEKAKDCEKAVEQFRSQMMNDVKDYDKQMKTQEMSERQKEGFLPMASVLQKYHELEKEVVPVMKKETLTKGEFARVQLYVLLSCLLLIEPRRSLDYTEFRLRGKDLIQDNYMMTEKRKPFFVFQSYKTAKKYGKQTLEIPAKLHKIVKRWSELNLHEYLLMNTVQSNKITPTQLTNLLYGFFDKPISTSMLRHIFLMDKYKGMPGINEMKDTAESMAHSVSQAMEYVKKVPK